MGADYSASVFFGACVPRKSKLGKRLARYVDEYGGTPAPTEFDGVEISTVGNSWAGEEWITVQAKGSVRSYGRNDETEPPEILTEGDGWREAIARFLVTQTKKHAAIGWHFAASVT